MSAKSSALVSQKLLGCVLLLVHFSDTKWPVIKEKEQNHLSLTVFRISLRDCISKMERYDFQYTQCFLY